MQLRTSLRALFLAICLAAAVLVLPAFARAADPHEHIAGAVWYPDDPDLHWQTCTLCGEKMNVEAHRWTIQAVEVPGSCTEDRVEFQICEVCQRTQRKVFYASGHVWDQGRVTQAPSCMEAGKMEYTCTVCGETCTGSIAPAGHRAGGAWIGNASQHWQLCSICGARVNAVPHQWSSWVTGAGNKQSRRCSVCGQAEIQKSAGTVAPDLVVMAPDGQVLQKSFVRDGRGYAVWNGTGTPRILSVSHPFEDVSPGAWYADTVTFVYSHGLLQGVSQSRFAPQSTMTRAMLAAAIYRIEGSPACTESHFSDVAPGAWYYDAVNWAASQGILAGTGGGKFSPNAPVTREQMVAILYRYAGYLGLDRTGRESLSRFTDSSSVSAYAVTAMEWSVAAGLISGMGDGRVAPKATATRGEVATVLRAMAVRITEELGTPLE